ncbi:MAG: DUF559 domain-containing protein [Candidatus Margulisiibacteriota bacterium]
MVRERLNRKIKETVRDLRKRQTKAETILWQALRSRKLRGKKFLRQHPLVFDWEGQERFLVPDFYCHEASLVIELDGGIHRHQEVHDKIREDVLQNLGLQVLRFRNELVLNNLLMVLKTIKQYL